MEFSRRAVLAASTSMATLSASGQTFSPQDREAFSRQFRSEGATPPPPTASIASASRFRMSLREQIENRRSVYDSPSDYLASIRSRPSRALAGTMSEYYQLLYWASVLMDINALDHTPQQDGKATRFAEQHGPHRSSRAYAIVQLAVHEAVHAIVARDPGAKTISSYKAPTAQAGELDARTQIVQGTLELIKPAFAGAALIPIASGPDAADGADVATAVAFAAYHTLRVLYPAKRDFLDVSLDEAVLIIGSEGKPSRTYGRYVGQEAARVILTQRGYHFVSGTFQDGSSHLEPSFDDYDPTKAEKPHAFPPGTQNLRPQNVLYRWKKDPVTNLPSAVGGMWWNVRPFAMTAPSQFRPLATDLPREDSEAFRRAFEDVRNLGGDEFLSRPPAPGDRVRHKTPTLRTDTTMSCDPHETHKGIYWGYDGTAMLCAPPRLYLSIAATIALSSADEYLHQEMGVGTSFPNGCSAKVEGVPANPLAPINDYRALSRFLALVCLAMADAGSAAWDAKYAFSVSRPITYFRDNRTPPPINDDLKKKGAGNDFDSGWTPLGGPVSNGSPDERNLTPPFPAFPSGHAVFGGALFEMIRAYYKVERRAAVAGEWVPTTSADYVPGGPEGSPSQKYKDEYGLIDSAYFYFVSDEYNGANLDPSTQRPRPRVERRFRSLREAEWENAQSRIWLGIHWQFDADIGVRMGNEVARHVFATTLVEQA